MWQSDWLRFCIHSFESEHHRVQESTGLHADVLPGGTDGRKQPHLLREVSTNKAIIHHVILLFRLDWDILVI